MPIHLKMHWNAFCFEGDSLKYKFNPITLNERPYHDLKSPEWLRCTLASALPLVLRALWVSRGISIQFFSKLPPAAEPLTTPSHACVLSRFRGIRLCDHGDCSLPDSSVHGLHKRAKKNACYRQITLFILPKTSILLHPLVTAGSLSSHLNLNMPTSVHPSLLISSSRKHPHIILFSVPASPLFL